MPVLLLFDHYELQDNLDTKIVIGLLEDLYLIQCHMCIW